MFDTVLDNLSKTNVIDLSIIEDFQELQSSEEDNMVNTSEDTMTILNKYIDGLTLEVKPDKLKSILREIYVEAVNVERT